MNERTNERPNERTNERTIGYDDNDEDNDDDDANADSTTASCALHSIEESHSRRSATITDTFTQLGRLCPPPFAWFLQQFSHFHYNPSPLTH
ncbi:hypothetical protein [Absidia glauca]|uniref:Ndc10 domain-containing protein n=1 Tax=Absidia glauca TaxID=4829 RepID=A0A163JG61_ABSGL|nr:hypothetical protein [Absidia glauca]